MCITRPVLPASRAMITAIALSISAPGTGAPAQTAREQLDRIEALIAQGSMREAMQQARALHLSLNDRADFAITRIVLTSGPAAGFADYEPRANNILPHGAPVHAYLEVAGATARQRPDGMSELLFLVDFAVLDAKGDRLTDVVRMGEVQMLSRSRGIDIYLEVTYNITGAPPGDYLLWTEVTDGIGGGSEQFELPITFASGG